MSFYDINSLLKTDTEPISYELGPARPPSEAHSMLIRVTRGCSWHKCLFCSSHRMMKFSIRSVDEIKRDIESGKMISDKIMAISEIDKIYGGIKGVAAKVYENAPNHNYSNIALWLHFGEGSVFLQDADSFSMKADKLVETLRFLKKIFPNISRVTSYARSQTAAMRTPDQLREQHDAGLTRLHMGLESGCDELLDFVKKGVVSDIHIDAGRKVTESGISLCAYIMPGLGGRHFSSEHVRSTIDVLNKINPAFIRIRSLTLREDLPLYEKFQNGEFKPLTDDEVIKEIRDIIEGLKVTSYFACDHIENLLQDVEGQLPEAKEELLGIIDRYLLMPAKEKTNFRLGRRAGYYNTLDDMNDPFRHEKIEHMLKDIRAKNEDFENVIFNLKRGFLV